MQLYRNFDKLIKKFTYFIYIIYNKYSLSLSHSLIFFILLFTNRSQETTLIITENSLLAQKFKQFGVKMGNGE